MGEVPNKGGKVLQGEMPFLIKSARIPETFREPILEKSRLCNSGYPYSLFSTTQLLIFGDSLKRKVRGGRRHNKWRENKVTFVYYDSESVEKKEKNEWKQRQGK